MRIHEFDSREWSAARQLLQAALDEDHATEDVTSRLAVPEEQRGRATLRMREAGVVAGLGAVAMCFDALDSDVDVDLRAADGQEHEAGATLAILSGLLHEILAAERSFLNVVGQLSGTATLTRRYVDAVGSRCTVLDTRKTWPGARLLQKYAVRCGGGENHRMGLHDAVLLKDNHRWSGFSLEQLVARAREDDARRVLVVEVDDEEQLDAALRLGVDRILLDNFDAERIRAAVERRAELNASTPFEASGGMDLEGARAASRAGAEYVSVGAITHSAPCLDLGLDLEQLEDA